MKSLVSALVACMICTIALLAQNAKPIDSAAVVRGVELTTMADGLWRHISYGFYNGEAVPSNGLIIEEPNGVTMIDTPWNDAQTDSLLIWCEKTLHKPLRRVIATHAHADRLGGIRTLLARKIDVLSTPLMAEQAVKRGFPAPSKPILPNDSTIQCGNFTLRVVFAGSGHTVENIVVWIAEQRLLVGGCLIKSSDTQGLGFIGDAVLNEWAQTVKTVQERFPMVRTVLPGHGEPGDKTLLSHTIELLGKRYRKP